MNPRARTRERRVARRRPQPRRLQVYSDPVQHAAIAVVVAAPLAARVGRRVLATAMTAALVIDVDHAVAAGSIRPRDTTALAQRPRTHSLLTATAAGGLVAAAAGPVHGWAAFAGLGSHLLHDAGDRAAPTPLLWPFGPARQLGRRRQLAGTLLLTIGSAAVGWAAAHERAAAAVRADGAGAAARQRTGSARS
jgi:membrane-bound metal-dependent hydrolase YbcI (DUF457 family)